MDAIEQIKEVRKHFKQCQLATWSDQQKFLRQANASWWNRSENNRMANICGLCLEIYQDILDRLDAITDQELAASDAGGKE